MGACLGGATVVEVDVVGAVGDVVLVAPGGRVDPGLPCPASPVMGRPSGVAESPREDPPVPDVPVVAGDVESCGTGRSA